MRLLFLLLCAQFAWAQKAQIVRGPYLQSVTPTSVLVHWRTDTPVASLVYYRASGKVLTVVDTNRVIDHVVSLQHLKPATKYAYQIDSKSFTEDRYVVTAPAFGSS